MVGDQQIFGWHSLLSPMLMENNELEHIKIVIFLKLC